MVPCEERGGLKSRGGASCGKLVTFTLERIEGEEFSSAVLFTLPSLSAPVPPPIILSHNQCYY